jgi:hypothetical protein
MDEPVQEAVVGLSKRIALLRAAGANRFDPVGQYYLESFAKRAATHQGRARFLLDEKLEKSLTAFVARFVLAQSEASGTLTETVAAYPHEADKLQRFFVASDFNGLKLCIEHVKKNSHPNPLGVLLRQFEQHVSGTKTGSQGASAGLRTELKTVRTARNIWSKLSSIRQVTRALEQAPKNAGPINSHMLVLRSLALMRDVSPDYLNRFMSYADTLLCLDHQAEKDKSANSKKSSPIKAAKK